MVASIRGLPRRRPPTKSLLWSPNYGEVEEEKPRDCLTSLHIVEKLVRDLSASIGRVPNESVTGHPEQSLNRPIPA